MARLRLALLVDPAGSAKVGASQGDSCFDGALLALRQLAVAEGPNLAPFLHLVLPPIGRRMFSRTHREAVQETLRELQELGGPEAAKVMRARGVTVGAR
mmetsp:Transcript_6457/g.14030  ORF Transcript_6457/g.14030 Transcript_6457/m.14030 type:complete len:99 (-) Transcript_6457:27-323(-)